MTMAQHLTSTHHCNNHLYHVNATAEYNLSIRNNYDSKCTLIYLCIQVFLADPCIEHILSLKTAAMLSNEVKVTRYFT